MIAAHFVLSLLVLGESATRRTPVVQVVEKLSPSVVSIGAVQAADPRLRSRNSLQELLFGAQDEAPVGESLGSGVIIDPSGIVVTNEHVIRGASAIHVLLADGRQLDAEVIGSDAENDLAVIKVPNGKFTAAKLGNSSDVLIGETVVAIGSPMGLKKTVTVGVISAVGRTIKPQERTYTDLIQTDASINLGNSGGPLVNLDGEVIGINSAILASAQNIGFAIPSDKVRRIVNELTRFGRVRPAWIGLDVRPLTPAITRRMGWDRTFGAFINAVERGSPAARAGIAVGDIVYQVGSTQIEDANDLRTRLRTATARSPVTMRIFRRGKPLEISMTPEEFPPEMIIGTVWEQLGLRVALSGSTVRITAVRPNSYPSRIGLGAGDIILRVNNTPLRSLEAFQNAIIEARGRSSVLLLVQRGRNGYYVTLPFESE